MGYNTNNKHNLQHGLYYHPLYTIWRGMRGRCNNPNQKGYDRYGGRGVRILFDNVEHFITWVLANLGERPEGMTLDRIDNDGHYAPGNLRWATQSKQVTNSSRAVGVSGIKWVHPYHNKWRGSFRLGGRTYTTRSYPTREQAYHEVLARRLEVDWCDT